MSRSVDRSKWLKFGEATKDIKCTYMADEVEIEFIVKEKKESSFKPNGYWITFARNQGWSVSDINDIMRSPDPAAVALKMYERILNTENAKLRMELDKQMAEYDRRRADILNAEQKEKEPASLSVASPPVAESGTPEPPKSGLRARFSAKQSENKKADDESAVKSGGIASRLKKLKQTKEQSEQDSTLFVRNVPEDYTEQDVKTVLTDFKIVRVNIVRKANGDDVRVSTGSAFVVLSSREEAVACMEFLHGYHWCNVIASVDFSKPKI
jgi:RNA recognition motif-containing protein